MFSKSISGLIIAFVLLFLGQNTKAQDDQRHTYKVAGNVFIEKDKKPKKGVRVFAYSYVEEQSTMTKVFTIMSTKHVVRTNDNGKFTLELYGDTDYMINFIVDGYYTKPVFFEKKGVESGEQISIEVPLSKGEFMAYNGTVIDIEDGKPLAGVEVSLTDVFKGLAKRMKTNADGKFLFAIEKRSVYRLEAKKDGYFYTMLRNLTPDSIHNDKDLWKVALDPIAVGKIIPLDTFPFAVNSDEMLPVGVNELNDIYRLLFVNPRLKIEIACHSDSRGHHEYNKKLSQRRAEKCRDFLMRKNVDPERVSAVGYGEERLLNECGEGVKCNNRRHSKNRRVEVVIKGVH